MNRSLLLIIILFSIVFMGVLFAGPASAQPRGYYHNYGYGGYGPGMMWGGGYGWFGGISTLIFWGLIIFVVILGIRWLMRSTGDRGGCSVPTRSRPLDILKERYARGEISKEDYQNMRKDLED